MAIINALTDTWNNVATTFTAIKMDVTDTTSAAGSKLIDLLVAASSKFSVSKAGNVTFAGVALGSAGAVGAPTYAFSGFATTGLYTVGGALNFAIVGNQKFSMGAFNMLIDSGYLFNWNNDAGISRNAAGVMEVNTGTASGTGNYRDIKVRTYLADATITAGGTTGAQTINKSLGTVNFAAAATSLVVTNSLVTTSSVVLPVIRTNDATFKSAQVVCAAGSFTIFANAAATAETSVGFIVHNG